MNEFEKKENKPTPKWKTEWEGTLEWFNLTRFGMQFFRTVCFVLKYSICFMYVKMNEYVRLSSPQIMQIAIVITLRI